MNQQEMQALIEATARQLRDLAVKLDETGFPIFEKDGSTDWHEPLNAAFALCAKLGDILAHNADPNAHGGLDWSGVLEGYAKLEHTHTVGQIEGLAPMLEEYRDQIAQLQDLISGDMPGAILYNVDLSTLDGITIRDGVWNPARRTIEA